MVSIKDFLSVYQQIIPLFEKYGFVEPVIFKGFSSKEKHNLNILVQDNELDESKSRPLSVRELLLKDEIMKIINCKIIITTTEDMDPYYYGKLTNTNSVKLTPHSPVNHIEEVFGNNWEFNPPEKLATFWASPTQSRKSDDSISKEKDISSIVENEFSDVTNSITTKLKHYQGQIDLDVLFDKLKLSVSKNLVKNIRSFSPPIEQK